MPALLGALLLGTPARAEESDAEPGWYVGLPVAGVTLRAPEGGLPDETLEPLLRSRQGEPADPQRIRTDIATLFRVGDFAAVEADVQPWFVDTGGGELREAVLLTYLLYPAPKVERVRVQGNEKASVKEVLDAAALSPGMVHYPALDGPRVAERVVEALQRKGFPDAAVEIDPQPLPEGRLEIWIRVAEGAPRTVGEVRFAGDLPVPERRLRRWARQEGVKPGEPVSVEILERARYGIRSHLARRPGWFGRKLGRRGGWVEARVAPAAIAESEDGALDVTWTVEPGARLVLEVDGLGWEDVQRPIAKTSDALDIDERLRLTRGFVEEAPERMERWLGERGYLDAEVQVSLEPGEETQTLRVVVDRGQAYRLRRLQRRMRFTGAEALTPHQLKAVMDQASPDILKRGLVTREEVDAGLSAAEALYQANGHQSARLRLTEMELDTYVAAGLIRLPVPQESERLLGIFRTRRNVRLHVEVDEGPLTRLGTLVVEGAAEEVPLDAVLVRMARLQSQPYSPQALERSARRIVETHRAGGYLSADARVVAQEGEPGMVDARVVVEPGPRVLLRSVTTRGVRRTRSSVVRREVDDVLVLGQPLTPADLEQVRRNLYEIGVFRSITTELIGEREAGDLVLTVEERPRWAYELGAGVATDQGIRGFGRVGRRNIAGRAHRLDLFLLAGFEWRSDALTDWWPDFTDPEYRAAATYTAPRFPLRRQRLVIDGLFRELVQERTWRMARSGVGLGLESILPIPATVRVGARVEWRSLTEVDPGALLEGEPWHAMLEEDPDGVPTATRLQDSLNMLVLYDRRDDPLDPSRGFLASVYGDWSPGLGRNDVPFLRSEARFSSFVPVGPLLLRLGAEAGHAFVLGDGVLPLEERYRLGGTGSLRGFRRDAVGPRNQVDQPEIAWPDALEPTIGASLRDHSQRWVATGGDTRASGVAELLVPLPALGLRDWDGYAAALFVDVGNVWLLRSPTTATSDQDKYRDVFASPFRYGVGAGLRMSTPVGPLQVDLAANPEAMLSDGARRALLRDEWDEPSFRAHLSLGSLW